MHLKIHRGTKEIGGSCVEIWTETTRIVLDIGMPLVEKDGREFEFRKYKSLTTKELIKQSILPDIDGFYFDSDKLIDGVIISHAHIDHYGFSNFVHPDTQYFMGEATYKLIELTSIFTPQKPIIKNVEYFEKSKSFKIGDIKITPYWMDHSAFDAYAFLIESNGKSIFYSGDFRGHGRKRKVFKWFLHNAPKNVDLLLLEGTRIDRDSDVEKTEDDLENDLVYIFSEKGIINLINTSSQNIDRLVSIYRACKRSGKTMVIDVYTACILKKLSKYASIPYPSKQFTDIKVMFPYYLCKKLTRENNERLLYQFRGYKITKDQINEDHESIAMIVRPSMKKDLERIEGIDGGNIIYSLWEGYLQRQYTKEFIEYLLDRKFHLYKIHNSGHADIKTLAAMTDAVKPKKIIPMHTFGRKMYKEYFDYQIVDVSDGEEVSIVLENSKNKLRRCRCT